MANTQATDAEEKGIFAESNEKDFEQIEPGSYIARAVKMIDIGTQRYKDFSTDDIVLKHEVIIYWEILEDEDNEKVRMQDGKPFLVQRKYKLSMHPKANLRKDLDAWRGKPFTEDEAKRFNITKLLNTYCRINLVQSEDGKYINVNSVAFSKRKPEGVTEPVWWNATDPDCDMQVYEKFPEWLRKKIADCEEWLKEESDQKASKAKAPTSKSVHAPEDDVVIEDVDLDKPIDLSQIPF